MKPPRARFTVCRMMFAVLVSALVLSYVGSYYWSINSNFARKVGGAHLHKL
jgi:hypothetical protein